MTHLISYLTVIKQLPHLVTKCKDFNKKSKLHALTTKLYIDGYKLTNKGVSANTFSKVSVLISNGKEYNVLNRNFSDKSMAIVHTMSR